MLIEQWVVLFYSFYWGKIKKEVKRFVENAWKKEKEMLFMLNW